MHKLYKETGKLIGVVTLFCLLLIFLIWNQLLQQLKRDRRETITIAIQRNSNLSASLEQYAISTIKNADAVLKLIKMEYENKKENLDFNSLIKQGVIDTKSYNGIILIGPTGQLKLINLTIQNYTIHNFSDKEYFTFHKKHKNKLYISQPIHSRTIKNGAIVLSRRINNPDGSFGGAVAVQIEPYTFTKFYSNANLKTHDIISLIAPNGLTYARRTGKKESYGEDISKSPLFSYLAKNPVGSYFSKDAIHGIPTYFSYRQLADYPMIATVGSAKDDILCEYYLRAKRGYIYGIIVTLLLVLFSVLICTALIQRRKSIKKAKDSEARYRSIFVNSHDGIILLSPNGFIEAINEAAHKLFKVDVTSSNEIQFNQLFLHADPQLFLTQNNFRHEEPEKEIIFTCIDGSEFIGEIAYSSFKDSSEKEHLVINIRDITSRKEMEQKLLKEQKRFQRKLTKQIILAQERERELIGHELHDNVNQILTTVKLYLELAFNNPETREQLIPKSIMYLMSCITEIRNLSHALSAPTLGTQSLVDSIKALVETVASSSQLRIHFIHDTYHTSLIKDQKLAIYRILQEQLNNIIKHSGATEVTIVISQTDKLTQLWISDNGKGFDVNARRNGIGLNNIMSRTKVFGGELKIESQKGQGCVLQISIPTIKIETPEDKTGVLPEVLN